MAKKRTPAPRAPPLDNGPRRGPELWRTISGVEFCHWDRWLLRLALTEPAGLESIEATFVGRARGPAGPDEAVEAMVAQVRDLKRRLDALSTTPQLILDAEERVSDWLLKKAWQRVWHEGPHRRTPAMLQTPRRVLEQRALRGAWPTFPVSPGIFEEKLRAGFGTGIIEYRFTNLVTRGLELEVFMQARQTRDRPTLLALYRAALTVIIEAMDRVDDSDADLAVAFRTFEGSYLELVPEFLERGDVLRDLVELWIWEDYGLCSGIKPFLENIPQEHAPSARQVLALVMAELEAEGLASQLSKAKALR